MASFSVVCALAVFGLAGPVFAQVSISSIPTVDPAATCPYQIADLIQQCRATVYADEAALPGGPCTSTDWACICNVQQGLVACYYPCPGNTPATDLDYNNANCNGQNGVVNAAASSGGAEYSGSPLTTTVPASLSSVLTASTTAAAGTTSTTAAVATTTATSGSTQSTSAASSSPSSAGPSSSVPTAASSGSTPAPSSSSNVFGSGSAVSGMGVSYLAAVCAGLVGVGALMVAAV